MKNGWRAKAKTVINEVIDNFFEQNNYPKTQRLSFTEIKQLESLISKAYPFGQRKYYPYEIWLKEVKEHIRYLKGLPPLNLPSVEIRLKNAPIPPGQLSLFN